MLTTINNDKHKHLDIKIDCSSCWNWTV